MLSGDDTISQLTDLIAVRREFIIDAAGALFLRWCSRFFCKGFFCEETVTMQGSHRHKRLGLEGLAETRAALVWAYLSQVNLAILRMASSP